MLHTYTQLHKDGLARTGTYETSHGVFETPNFMPVGTRGSVKGVDCERLHEIGTQIMLVNTYHLWLRPGPGVVATLGGIHKFTQWPGPILSDSGGFQVFSLQGIRKLSEEGVEFRSHIDGSKQFLSPEKSIEIQQQLGVDIAMVLDECPSGELPHDQVSKSLDLTIRWARRSHQARNRPETAIFGITQGGIFRDLRTRAAQELSEIDFDGMAIGGLSVGERKEHMYDVLSYHPAQLPENKIRYLMGVGTPEDIVEAVRQGVDLFDCVMPTRSGRCARAFVRGELPYLNLRNSQYVTQNDPLDSECDCLCCRHYSRGYLHHLFKVEEMLGPQLVSIHNLRHYLSLMSDIRRAIREGNFESIYLREKKRWKNLNDLQNPKETCAE